MVCNDLNALIDRVIEEREIPDIQENYINLKRLWIEAGLDRLTRKFTIATDLKLCKVLGRRECVCVVGGGGGGGGGVPKIGRKIRRGGVSIAQKRV